MSVQPPINGPHSPIQQIAVLAVSDNTIAAQDISKNRYIAYEKEGKEIVFKKAGIIVTLIETIKGWIGLGNRTSQETIEYYLIRIFSE